MVLGSFGFRVETPSFGGVGIQSFVFGGFRGLGFRASCLGFRVQ